MTFTVLRSFADPEEEPSSPRVVARDRPMIFVECNAQTLRWSGHTPTDLVERLRQAQYFIYCVEQLRTAPDPVWNLLASPEPIADLMRLEWH